MPKRINLLGEKIGRWTVIADSKNGKYKGYSYWDCKCECGVERTVIAQQLLNGSSLSCGCLKKEKMGERARTHGHSVRSGKRSPEYLAWCNMKARCYRKNLKEYKNYGGRGIVVCERWKNSFENFLADMGVRPSEKHSLDKYPNNDGNYEPTNCRWATVPEQMRNRTENVWLEYNGEKMVMQDWATHFGFHKSSLATQLKKMPFKDAIYYLQNVAKPKGAGGKDNPHAKRIARYVNDVLIKEYEYIKQVEEDGFLVKRVYGSLHKRGGRDKDGTFWKYLDGKAA